MAHLTRLTIHATWDDDARVWVATSDDVPGLATEADDMDALVAKLKTLIPELLDYSPISNRRFVVDSKIKSRHTANAVLKQAGLPKKF